MIMEVRWNHGKTLEQNNMEIAKLALKLAMGDLERASTSLGIEVDHLVSLLAQAEEDQKVQQNAQKRYDAQRKLAHAKLTAPVQSHQHVQWNDKEDMEPDQGLQAVGQTPLEARTESGMSDQLGRRPVTIPTNEPIQAASTTLATSTAKSGTSDAKPKSSGTRKPPSKTTKATSKSKGA